SLLVQRRNGIHARSTPRGNVCREHGHHENGERDDQEEPRLAKVKAIEYSVEQFWQRQRQTESDSPSDCSHFQPFSQDHTQHVRRSGSKSHADPDFVLSLAHGIGNKPVNSNRREDERQTSEAAQYPHEEWISRLLPLDHNGHAHYAIQWKLGIHLSNRIAQCRGKTARIRVRTNHERKGTYGPLQEGFVDFGVVASFFGIDFHVANNSYDLAPLRLRAVHIQANLLT